MDFPPGRCKLLEQVGEIVSADLDRSGLLSAVEEADVPLGPPRHRIDAEVMTAARNLKVMVTAPRASTTST